MRKRWASWAVAAVCLGFVATLAPLFAEGEPPGLDLPIHLAEIRSLATSIAAGDVGGWSPSANLGFASGAYYQVLPQLVVAAAFVALGRFVSLLFLFKLAIVLPLALLPATVARGLVVAGARPRGAALAALTSACVFAVPAWGVGPDAVLRLGLFTQAWGLLFYPLALAHGARTLDDGTNRGQAVGYALACGLCHPFVAVCLAPALAVVVLARRGRGLGRAVVLLVLVLAASAFFWAPILVEHSSFGGFPARRGEESGLRPGAFFALFLRGGLLDAGRWPLLSYAALTASAFAIWRRQRLLRVVLAQGALFGMLVMVGPLVGPVAGDLVPGIRFLAPFQLALAAAAGLALAEAPRVVVALLVVALGAGAATRLADLTGTLAGDPKVFRAELGEMLRVLAALPPGRIATGRSLGTAIPAWSYLPAVYAGKPALRAFGGAALQSSTNYAALRDAEPRDEVTRCAIRYAFVRRAQVLPDDRVLARTDHFALVELGSGTLFGPAGAVLSEAEAPSRYRAEVAVPVPTQIVLRVTYHPWWRATVDGAAVETERLRDPDILGVEVGPGRHQVELRFQRPWWTFALLAAGAAIFVLSWGRWWRRCSRSRWRRS